MMHTRPKNGDKTLQALKRQLNTSYDVLRWNRSFLISFSKTHHTTNRVQVYIEKYERQMRAISRLSNLLD